MLNTVVDNQDSILVGEVNKAVWIRVDGKGSFQNSPQVKEFAIRMIDRGRTDIVVDLENCTSMDSTFMGTLTGIAIRIKARCDGKLDIINTNPRNQELLESLGLDQILAVDLDGSAWKEEREFVKENLTKAITPKLDKSDRAEFVLEAHEDLCKANEENIGRFKDVIEFLKHDTNKQSS